MAEACGEERGDGEDRERSQKSEGEHRRDAASEEMDGDECALT